MQSSLSWPPGMEAVELMVMHSEYHKAGRMLYRSKCGKSCC
jgi:hypothetical protein